MKYQYLAPMLLNELQKQHTVVAEDVIKTQQKQIDEMAAPVFASKLSLGTST